MGHFVVGPEYPVKYMCKDISCFFSALGSQPHRETSTKANTRLEKKKVLWTDFSPCVAITKHFVKIYTIYLLFGRNL